MFQLSTKKKADLEDELPDYRGKVIGKKYHLIEPIGHGAHGRVYIGADLYTQEPIACKLMAKQKRHKMKF